MKKTSVLLSVFSAIGLAASMATPVLAAEVRLPRCDRDRPDTTTSSQRSPFKNVTKFRAALDRVRVFQHPTSSECLSESQIKAGFIRRNIFFLNGSNDMVFRIPTLSGGDVARARSRAELRGNNFSVTRNAEMRFDYTIPSGRTYADGFTIGQILSDTPENTDISGVPLMRLEVIKSRSGKRNHLWAIFKPSETGDTLFRDLGPAAIGKVGKVQVEWADAGGVTLRRSSGNLDGSGKIRVRHQVGTNTITRTYNITNIKLPIGVSNVYFKTGCYTQKPGACENRVRQLTFRNVPTSG